MWKSNLKSQVMEIGIWSKLGILVEISIWLASMDHLMQLKKKGLGEFVCFTRINSKALDLLWRLQHCLG